MLSGMPHTHMCVHIYRERERERERERGRGRAPLNQDVGPCLYVLFVVPLVGSTHGALIWALKLVFLIWLEGLKSEPQSREPQEYGRKTIGTCLPGVGRFLFIFLLYSWGSLLWAPHVSPFCWGWGLKRGHQDPLPADLAARSPPGLATWLRGAMLLGATS